MPQTVLIKAENVSKTVLSGERELTILDQLNLEIAAGKAVAITGASGSGKSTLLGLLAGLDIPTSGQLSLFGQPLNNLDEDARARLRAGRVGFVFQSFQLLPGLTALENVRIPLELSKQKQNITVQARQALADVGLADREDHLPGQLSGGEQQRVALARAFITRPEVLFADEPTGNLDQSTGEQIIDMLFAMQASKQTTLLLVTHDEALAKRCDQRLHLDNGRLTG